jgi:PAS domain S-box-containing protein
VRPGDYRKIFEAAPDSVFLVSSDPAEQGRILDANDQAAVSHGYTREELLRLRITDLDVPESACSAPERIARILTGEHFVFEVRHRRKDGSEFPVEVTARTVDFEGRRCIVSFNRDVTERRRAEAALRDSDARWRFAVESAGDGIWDWNVATGEVFYSSRWKSMLGYRDEELGDSFAVWEQLLHPDDRASALATVAAYHRGEHTAFVLEHRMRCKDGTWKWIRSRGEVTEWTSSGQPRRMLGTHTDIDHSRRREESERVLRQRLNLALQAGHFGLFERDLVTDVAVWDDRAYEIFGLKRKGPGPSRDEIAKVMEPEDLARWRQGLTEATNGQENLSLEVRIRWPSGELRTVVGRAVIQPTPDGKSRMMTGIFEDITARRQAEEERVILLERYDTIFHSVSEGLTLQRVNDAIVDCNSAAERILGLTRRQLLGLDSFDARWRSVNVQGEPLAGDEHPTMVVSRTNRSVRGFMMGVQRSDGRQVWLSVNAEPIRSKEGHVTHVVASFTDVTAQRLAEEESRRANERLQAAVAVSRIVWWEWQVAAGDFKVSAFGQPCILGYTPEQLANISGGRWLELTHPDDRTMVKQTLEEALAGRVETWVSKHRLLASDGSWRWVRNNGRVKRRAADGTPLVMVGITQDQHDHYDAEARAQASAERLQIALGASAMGIWRYNLQTGAAEWDERQRELFGLPLTGAAPTMEEFLAMLVAEDRSAVQAAWATVTPENPNFEYSFRIGSAAGQVRHIRCVGTMRFDETGRPDWATGINEDVSAERQQALALGELNGRLQLALRAARFGVWEIDLESKRVTWDDALFGIYGITPSEFGGSLKVFRELVHPADRERITREGDQLLAGAPARSREFRIQRRSDGAERTIEAISYVVRDPEGRPVRLVGMDRDVTDQREAETKQRQLETQLMQAQKLETLGTLAGGIAHDFNNLLTGVLGFIDLSLHATPAGHEAVDYLRNARDGSMRARELVKRLLLFARQAPATARQPIQLGHLIVETLPLLTATLPSSIVIQTQLDGTVGPVLADAGQLQQVLMNLCVNAAHAIGGRQGKITLELTPSRDCPAGGDKCAQGPYVCLAVADNGSGMNAATQARVFDPFFTTKGLGEGTGLGLSIVHGIVHEHGGCIRLQSEVGAGTRFEIFLPVGGAAQPAVTATAEAVPALPGSGRRVLVADDETQVRLLVATVLKRVGFEVDACADGAVAAEHFAGAPASYALALLDLSMPGRTGLELIAEIHARRPGLPIILMSGDHDRYGHKPEFEEGVVVRLGKPFSVEELRAAVQQALRR